MERYSYVFSYVCAKNMQSLKHSPIAKPITKKFIISSAGFASNARVGSGEKEAVSLPKASNEVAAAAWLWLEWWCTGSRQMGQTSGLHQRVCRVSAG
jgi:hypothetical protein